MQARKAKVSAVLGFAMLLLFTTVNAADREHEGWFGTLDLGLTQPNSLDQHYADHLDYSGAVTKVTPLSMDNGSDLTWKLSFGYSWGKMGSLQVSYWTFDNDDDESDTYQGGVYSTIIDSMYASYGFGSGVGVQAESSIEATTFDVDYIRPIPVGDKFTVKWLAGLRVASYEETRRVEIDDSSIQYVDEKQWKSDAFGLRVGAAANWAFTDRFSLEGNVTLSFLQADSTGQTVQHDTIGPLEIREAAVDNIRGEMRDYGLKALWEMGPAEVHVGYQMSTWDGLVADPLPAGDSRDGISFNSWTAGATWRFGGK